MKGIFRIEKPEQVRVELTVSMTLGEAMAVRDFLLNATAQGYPDAVRELRRQVSAMITSCEQRFTSGPIHTERPDG